MTMPYYVEAGSGDTSIYLLHGGSGDHSYWSDDVAALVEAGYRVIAWDAPGFGRSAELEAYSIEALADIAAALIDATGSEHNVIVAQSFGGIIAPAIIQRTNKRIDALVAASAPAVRLAPPAPPAETASTPAPAQQPPPGADRRQAARAGQMRAVMAPGASGPAVELVVDVASRSPTDAVLAKVLQAIRSYDAIPAASALEIPTMFLAGEYDPVATPEAIERTAELVEGAEYHLIRDSGHFIFAEQPERYRALLFAFLEKVGLGNRS